MKNLIFDAAFIDSLPEDNMLALLAICRKYNYLRPGGDADNRAFDIEAYGFLRVFTRTRKIVVPGIAFPEANALGPNTAHQIFQVLTSKGVEYEKGHLLQTAEEAYQLILRKDFSYEFTEGDLAEIQKLLNELRDQIVKCEAIKEDHKNRLLKRLEQLQQQLHKNVTNLDKYWGLFVEANILLQKTGKVVLPIVQGVKKIIDVVWATQTRAEQLPSGTKFELPDEETLQLPRSSNNPDDVA